MTKKRTTFEEAIVIYKEVNGTEPTLNQIINLWHEYGKNWKQYNGFEDYLRNI